MGVDGAGIGGKRGRAGMGRKIMSVQRRGEVSERLVERIRADGWILIAWIRTRIFYYVVERK